ncbi:uncharacterized protein LOC128740187 [Sabethes cyaneus]|uniref:uncharacterized protein LOC128740187 n=1 Tax=Sabethes cyaneus TaxID=53552 RepID=UPI00237D591C|nr:uncharacterized protein LOC128740187 [Sabethes cyaneus]
MGDDPGGGEPSRAFGSRFGPLAYIEDREAKQTGTTHKHKKRGITRDLVQEKSFAKEARLEGNNGSRYLILTRTDEGETMEKVSPFFIKKAIDTITPNVVISRMREGKLMLKSIDRQQAEKLMKQTVLGGKISIKVEEHPTLNLTKGVISCRDFKYLKDEEILEELKTEHVVAIRRFKDRIQDGKPLISSTFVLTFNLGHLPSSINVGFYNCRVKQYIPSPLRCFNCLQFGHSKERCRGNRICAKCAKLYHEQDCISPVVCVNCRHEHHALSKTCPVYEDECEIQKLRVTEKISIREATRKRRLQAPNPIPARLTRSFAEVAQHAVNERTKPEAFNKNNAAAVVVRSDAAAATARPINKAGDANQTESSVLSKKAIAVNQVRKPVTEETEGNLTPLTLEINNNVIKMREKNALQHNVLTPIETVEQDEILATTEDLLEDSLYHPILNKNKVSIISQAISTSMFIDESNLEDL